MKAENPHWGPRLEEFLSDEGIREAAKAAANARLAAWWLGEQRERTHEPG